MNPAQLSIALAALGIPENIQYTIALGAIPAGIPSSGSVGINGALTVNTAFLKVYSDGVWLYFPAGAVYAGSLAGMYWCVMSSTTVGTVYAHRGAGWLIGTTGVATPIVSASIGAYVTPTTAITVSSVTLPGGALGLNGSLFVYTINNWVNSADYKTVAFKIGAVTLFNSARNTNSGHQNGVEVTNKGSQAISIVTDRALGAGVYAAPSEIALNLGVSNALDLVVQVGASASHNLISRAFIEVNPRG